MGRWRRHRATVQSFIQTRNFRSVLFIKNPVVRQTRHNAASGSGGRWRSKTRVTSEISSFSSVWRYLNFRQFVRFMVCWVRMSFPNPWRADETYSHWRLEVSGGSNVESNRFVISAVWASVGGLVSGEQRGRSLMSIICTNLVLYWPQGMQQTMVGQ